MVSVYLPASPTQGRGGLAVEKAITPHIDGLNPKNHNNKLAASLRDAETLDILYLTVSGRVSQRVAFEIEGSLNTSANGKVRIMSKVEVSPPSGCPCLGA
jgi:hypothetical protein